MVEQKIVKEVAEDWAVYTSEFEQPLNTRQYTLIIQNIHMPSGQKIGSSLT